jgi:hypothetical protein
MTPRFGPLTSDARGVVLVEFLIALLPVLLLFLSVLQLAVLGAAKLVVQHAAVAGARSACVVLDDDPARYADEPRGAITGERMHTIERAARAALSVLPVLPGRAAELTLPEQSGLADLARDVISDEETVTVRVEHLAPCLVPVARTLICSPVTLSEGETTVRALLLSAESTMPRFGARYSYPSEQAGGDR